MRGSQHRWGWRHLFLLLLAAVLLYIGYSSIQVVRRAQSLRAHVQELRRLQPNNLASLDTTLVALQQDVALLRRDLAAPLAIMPHLGWAPRIGPTLEALPQLFYAGQMLLDAGVSVWQIVSDPAHAALAGSMEIDVAARETLTRLESHALQLEELASDVRQACQSIERIEAERLIAPLAGPVGQLQDIAPLISAGMDGLSVLHTFIGGEEPKTLLILAQNNDELRPTGGFISSVGALVVGAGELRLIPFEDSYRLENWDKPHPDPPEPLRTYMGLDLWVTRDGNWWPDFPTSARSILDLYALNRGERPHGVIAVDMSAAERLMQALAPLKLPSGEVVRRDGVSEYFRASWSLAPGSLVTSGILVTATQPFEAIELDLSYSHKQGVAWFDSVQVEQIDRPGLNLVQNPSFELDANGDELPDGWTPYGLSEGDGLASDHAHSGERSLRIVGNAQEKKGIKQRLAISGAAGTVFRVSAESRGDDTNTEGGPYALTISFIDKNGRARSTAAGFPVLTHDWSTAGSASILGEWWSQRKDFMDELAQAALRKLSSNPSQIAWLDVLRTTRELLDERHVQMYVDHEPLQSVAQRYGWDGALAAPEQDYLLVVDSNMGYNKVASNIEQAIHYEVLFDSAGQAQARLEITYHNHSAATSNECDKFRQYVPTYDALTQGCYWDYVRVYVPLGSALQSASGGDEPAHAASELERTTFATYFVLRPGETRTLLFAYQLPASVVQDGVYRLYAQKQSGTQALPLMIMLRDARLEDAEQNDMQFKMDLRVDRRFEARLTPLTGR